MNKYDKILLPDDRTTAQLQVVASGGLSKVAKARLELPGLSKIAKARLDLTPPPGTPTHSDSILATPAVP